MKVSIKKISLEQFKSRMPGIMPSVIDVWKIPIIDDTLYYVYSDAVEEATKRGVSRDNIVKYRKFVDFLDEYGNNYNGNYDCIPSDMDVTSFNITDNTDILINIPVAQSSYYDNIGYTYYTIEQFSKKDILSLIYDFENGQYDALNVEYYCYYNGEIYYCNDILKLKGKIYDLTNDEIINIEDEDNKRLFTKKKYVTYNTLKKWFHFFEEYYFYLNSAKTHYDNLVELKTKDPYIINLTMDECEEYDRLFVSRGGDALYDYISNTTFAKFKIPKEYVEYWGAKYLFYPDAIKWYGWFKELYETYSEIEDIYKCKDSTNCCECEEYINRGGNNIFDLLSQWIGTVHKNEFATNSASCSLNILLESNIYDIGQMSIFSERYNSKNNYHSTLDGDSSNGGTVAIYDDDVYVISGGNTYASSLQYTGRKYNPQTMKNEFDVEQWGDYYNEYRKTNPEEFSTIMHSYAINHNDKLIYNPTDSSMAIKYDLYRSDNGFIPIKGIEYEILMMPYVIYINKNTASLNNGVEFPVYTDSYGNYYAVIDGVTYYAVKKNGWYYFNFNVSKECDHLEDYDCKMISNTRCILYGDKFIRTDFVKYNGKTYEVADVFDGKQHILYSKINAYTYIDDVKYYVVGNSMEIITDTGKYSMFNEEGKFIVEYDVVENIWVNNTKYPYVNKDSVSVLYPYTVTYCDKITGTSASMFDVFKPYNLTIDDIGNVMPGYYDFNVDGLSEEYWFNKYMDEGDRYNSKVAYPYDGVLLDWYHKVGDVSDLSINEQLNDENNIFKQYYDGNIIQKIKFYYLNRETNEPYEDSIVELSNDKFSNGKYFRIHNNSYLQYCDDNGIEIPNIERENILEAIKLCKDIKNTIGYIYECNNCHKLLTNDLLLDGDVCPYCGGFDFTYINDSDVYLSDEMHCTIEYNIGAIIHKRISVIEDESNYTYSFDGYEIERSNTGIGPKYHPGITYIDTAEVVEDVCQYSLNNGSVYNLRYYKLNYDTRRITVDNDIVYDFVESKFSMPILTYDLNGNPDSKFYNDGYGFGSTNETTLSPVYRDEYNSGIVYPSNIDADIYIDRGIYKSLDKHIKLQEIRTIEALENYGNSMFKIME